MALKFSGKISGLLFTRLFLLFASFACFFVSGKTSKKHRVANFHLSIDSLNKNEPLVTPAFQVKKEVGIYKIDISIYPAMTRANKNFIYLMAELHDNNEVRINEFEHEYWWETGHDSDGSWTEEEKSESWFFKNRNKNDSLYLEIYGEKKLNKQKYYRDLNQKTKYGKNTYYYRYAQSIRVQVWEDSQGTVRSYFFIAAVVFLVLFVIFIFGGSK